MASGATLITVTRVSGIFNERGPVGGITTLTRGRNTILLTSTTRDTPRIGVSIYSLSISFLTFSNRGLVTPVKVNILCNGSRLLRGVPPFLSNNRVVRCMAHRNTACTRLPRGFRTNAIGTNNTYKLTTTVSCVRDIKFRGITRERGRLTRVTLSKLGRLGSIGVVNSRGPTRRYNVVAFAMGKIRPRSVDTVLSTSNITVHTNRRYTRPLVGCLNAPSATETDFFFCGARRRTQHFIRSISRLEEGVKCKR